MILRSPIATKAKLGFYKLIGLSPVGELTSLPTGGARPFEPLAYERLFGDYWKQVPS
jgi:hypothetical protein